MNNIVFFGNFDVTELTLYAFFLFFFGLVLYLRREDRREGYPLEDDATGRRESIPGFLWYPEPKTFLLPHGRGTVVKPDDARDHSVFSASRAAPWAGSPLVPEGDPLTAGIGPGATAQRADLPDVMLNGEPLIVPLRVATDFSIAKEDPDLRGYTVLGADGVTAGKVRDVWVDRAEFILRYVEITTSSGRNVLAPINMVDIGKKSVRVQSLLASQLDGAPTLANPDRITVLEEEKISAYCGAGYLYATPSKAEPLL